MSLILDALRKSEAQRRRGQAPDLFASPPPTMPRTHSRWLQPWPWLSVLALVLVLGFLIWPQPPREPDALTPTDASETMESRTARTAAGPVQAAALPPVSASSRPPPAAPERVPAGAPVSPAPPVPTPAPAIAPALPSPLPAPVEAVDAETLPPIAVLSATERMALPPMKLSMHVWNSEPGKRFAIIDGQRVAEGSMVGGSRIGEIRRDGVVLDINGRRILLPRP